jgi:hypothetical protein
MPWQRDLAGVVMVWMLGSLLLAVPVGRAQLAPDRSTASPRAAQEETLRSLLHSIAQLEQERAAKQAEFQSPQALGRQAEVTQEIKVLGDKLAVLRQQLNTVATAVDLTLFTKPSGSLHSTYNSASWMPLALW